MGITRIKSQCNIPIYLSCIACVMLFFLTTCVMLLMMSKELLQFTKSFVVILCCGVLFLNGQTERSWLIHYCNRNKTEWHKNYRPPFLLTTLAFSSFLSFNSTQTNPNLSILYSLFIFHTHTTNNKQQQLPPLS